ncbi:DUF4446 family protein [Lipingzhangella sp. LS1_29]|uniref:DUF4446 family protein n=1 Tax=Lipingzhangella rawalii TaxID=2055835 RepID=A0ABU2HCX3_9ACTN|nr:DUF4446 family protein [Lipingzhangella rawalii]
MLTTTLNALPVFALLLGLGGLVLGGLAFLRVQRATEDSRAMMQRLLPDSGGVDIHAIRDVALVRYNALAEMSGARSFSMALLNANGDGFVLTSINGRSETRTYAKVVANGQGEEQLSPEEYRAVRQARLGQGLGHRPPPGVAESPTTPPGTDTPTDSDAEELGDAPEITVQISGSSGRPSRNS